MDWLNRLSTRLGLLRAEVLMVSGALLLFIAGVTLKFFWGYAERAELIEKAQTELLLGNEPDSLLAAEAQLYEQSQTDTVRHAAPQRKLNFNTATQEELEALPDIGAVLADRLIRFRAYKGGKLHSLDELLEVKGITPARLRTLKAHLTLE